MLYMLQVKIWQKILFIKLLEPINLIYDRLIYLLPCVSMNLLLIYYFNLVICPIHTTIKQDICTILLLTFLNFEFQN